MPGFLVKSFETRLHSVLGHGVGKYPFFKSETWRIIEHFFFLQLYFFNFQNQKVLQKYQQVPATLGIRVCSLFMERGGGGGGWQMGKRNVWNFLYSPQ